MISYNTNRYVLTTTFLVGLPYSYAIKFIAMVAVSLIGGMLFGGIKIVLCGLAISLAFYFYQQNKYKKYGENETEVVVFNSRPKRIIMDDSRVFENLTAQKK